VSLRGMYAYADKVSKELGWNGSIEERDGKLHFSGTVASEDEKNRIWNAIKTIPTWEREVVADIRVKPRSEASASSSSQTSAPAARETTYTVQPGDTLSAIAKRMLGNANDYMAIFNANKDQLSDPDKIKPGQVLKIPQHAAH
jgi:LysM repeat protein